MDIVQKKKSTQKNKENEKKIQNKRSGLKGIEDLNDEDVQFALSETIVKKSQQNLETILENDAPGFQQQAENAQNGEDAWVDNQDEECKIDISQVARLRKLRQNKDQRVISGSQYQKRLKNFYENKLRTSDFYQWASSTNQVDEEQEQVQSVAKQVGNVETYQQESQESTLKNLKNLLRKKNDFEDQVSRNFFEPLPPTIIDIQQVGMVLQKDKHDAVVQSVDFYQNNSLFLTCGLDKLVQIFNIQQSNKVYTDKIKHMKTIYFENTPLLCAKFLNNRNEVLCSGIKKHLLTYNLITDRIEKISSNLFTERFDKKIDKFNISHDEKFLSLYNKEGYVMTLSADTQQFLFEFQMNQPCISTSFSNDSNYLFSTGQQGQIYQWDLRKRAILNCFQDSGSLITNTIDASPDGNYLASGSNTGLVNLYKIDAQTHTPFQEPVKEIQNLTTSITGVKFNSTSEIMVAWSKWKKNSIKLIHTATQTVFSNWPNLKTNVKFVSSAAFSKDSKYMILGTDAGKVFAYNLKNYNN